MKIMNRMACGLRNKHDWHPEPERDGVYRCTRCDATVRVRRFASYGAGSGDMGGAVGGGSGLDGGGGGDGGGG